VLAPFILCWSHIDFSQIYFIKSKHFNSRDAAFQHLNVTSKTISVI